MLSVLLTLFSIIILSFDPTIDFIPLFVCVLVFKAIFDIKNFISSILFLSWWIERSSFSLMLEIIFLLILYFSQRGLILDGKLSRAFKIWIMWFLYEGVRFSIVLDYDQSFLSQLSTTTIFFIISICILNQTVKENVFMLK